MSLITSVIVKNKSGSNLTINSLGFSVANEATQDLFAEDNSPDEIFLDEQIRELLSSGDLVVFFENLYELAIDDGLLLWDNRFIRPKTRQAGIPGISDDATIGITEGNEIYDTSGGMSYTCTDDSAGAAVWTDSQGNVV